MSANAIDRRLVLRSMAAAPALAAAMSGRADAAGQAGYLAVVAEIEAKPEHAAAMRALMVPFAASSRAEAGCRHYTLLEDPATPGRFFTYEVWTGHAALTGHMNGANVKAAGPKLAALLAKPPTQTLLGIVSAS
jgi:quinol monooxygenase YgiN